MISGNIAPLGLYPARLNDDDVNAEGLCLNAQAVGEALDGKLAGMVPRAEHRPYTPAHGRDVDDLSVVVLAHFRKDELDEPRRAEEQNIWRTRSLSFCPRHAIMTPSTKRSVSL